jgi:SAM-dependent methyltransferase
MSVTIWHEIECSGYEADLTLWEELAEAANGPVLDLGCGTGRVALHLARRDRPVLGLDLEEGLVVAFEARADGLPAEAEQGDARDFELGRRFGLVLAPMQLVQLFADEGERVACLRCVADHLTEGGLAAFAIVESMPEPVDAPLPLPDARETDGWVYSSLPLEASSTDGEIRVRRLRQTVAPDGTLGEAVDEVRLQALSAATLEAEAEAAALRPAGRREIPATDAHVGSTAVLLERVA